MSPIKDTVTLAAPVVLAPAQSPACATSTEAPTEFADREAYYANVRRGVAALSGEVEK